MKKTLLGTALLLAFCASAQEYEWQWAKKGGGTKRAQGEIGSFDYNSEQIIDVAVDGDNNYYYLAFMTQMNTEYDGMPVNVYNPQLLSFGMTDIVLISTDCEGTLRWTQTIGGGSSDYAYKIALDNNGGLYIGANIINVSSSLDEYLPPHFSPTDAMAVLGDNTGEPDEDYKTIALLKYNTNDGTLAWRVMPQGDVTMDLRNAQINQVAIDSDGIIHTLIGFREGTHLNGQVTVPSSTGSLKYFIVKYNDEGEILNIVPVSLEGNVYLQYTDFKYDEALQRYYLAGYRSNGNINELLPLSYNGVPLTEQAYILAIGNTGNEIWRKEVASVSDIQDNRIHALEIDSDSNIYVTGKYLVDLNNPGVSLGNYQFPSNIGGIINYTLKLNAEGVVQWISVPTSYTELSNPNFWSGSHFSYNLVINGNEIAIATQASDETWGSVSVDRPTNHLSDPALLRLNKETGEAIAVHDIMTSPGSRDALSAVAVDNDGNYIMGGYFYNDLFTLEDDNVPTINKVQNEISYTDFFIAKLAASACGSGTVGVDKHGYNNIRIYPNPVKELLTIETNETLKSYEVINLLGQVLLKGELQSSQSSISIEGLSAGTYILNVRTANGKLLSDKIVKQ